MSTTDSAQKELATVVILPASDDQNRGDQALVWETRRIGEAAGYRGAYYMLTDPSRRAVQSKAEGFMPLTPLLRHPSTRYEPGSNLRYGVALTSIWGTIALFDTIRSILLLTSLGRKLLWRFLDSSARQTLNTIANADVCMVKGGGFIHSTGSVTDPYRAFYSLFHLLLAQALGKKVVVMPNSFGPFEGRLYRHIVRKALKNCSLVTARESRSQNALKSIDIDAELHSDLAFGLESLDPARSQMELIREEAGDRKLVGITARPYRFPYSSDPSSAYTSYIAEMAKFAAWLYGRGFLPVFIEHVMGAGAHENDRYAIDGIVKQLDGVGYRIVAEPDYNCRELKRLYSQCDYVVGTRFHSVIFSLAESVPSLAIAYGGNKGQGIMADAGLGEFAIDIEAISKEGLAQAFVQMVDCPDLETRIESLQRDTHRSRIALEELVRSA